MNQRLQCSQGHEWDSTVSGYAETAETVARCPTCNEIGQAIGPDRNGPTSLFESQKSVFAGSDATLPGRHASDIAPNALPQAVAGYTILKELGRGGMGVVYLARQDKLNRLVALKMVLAGHHAGDQDRSRFLSEAAAVAQLKHPNIVQIYEIGESDGRPYFSLEYVDGGSLADRLDGTPIPPRDAATVCVTLARAVQSAHDAGIVHRDLKPANILLSGRVVSGNRSADDSPLTAHHSPLTAHQPKITDFGLAKQIGQTSGHTRTGAVLGTPSYMAPEQATGQLRAIGPATDTYALGAILYELVTGRPPFLGATPLDTVLQVASEEPVKPTQLQPKCPRDLETICLKCLQKDPRKRYESAGALADDLQHFLNGEPIKARPVGPVERAWRWTRRNPRVAALLSLLAAVLVVGFALVFALWRQAEARRERADQQEARAKKNLLMAIEAVDRMLTRVVDERLAYVPQFEDERRKILEDAVKFYREFLEQEHSDPALRREMGRAYYRLGKVFLTLGKHTQTQDALRQAQQLQEQLCREFPDNSEYRHDLALTLADLAVSYRLIGKVEEAGAFYDLAHQLAADLVKDHPDEPRYGETLAKLLRDQGFQRFQTGRIEQAEQSFVASLAEFDRVVALRPNELKYRMSRASARNSLGFFQMNMQRFDAAEKNLVSALNELEGLLRDYPEKKKEIDPELANVRLNLGSVYVSTNRPTQSDAILNKGMSTYRSLVQDYPKSPTYRYFLATGQRAIALQHQQTKNPEVAEKTLQEAITTLTQLDRDAPEVFYQGMTLRWAYLELAQVHRSQKNWGAAEADLRNAIQHALQDAHGQQPRPHILRDLSRARVALAEVLVERKESAKALAEMDVAIAEARAAATRFPAAGDSVHSLRLQKAVLMARAGDHVAALAEIAEPAFSTTKSGTDAYNLACVHALCAAAIQADEKLPSDTRQVRSNVEAQAAFGILQRLRSQGYFKFPGRVRELQSDNDLDALRGRPEFRSFVEELAPKPTKPN